MATINYIINVPDKNKCRSVSLVLRHQNSRKVVPMEIKLYPDEVSKTGNIKNYEKIHLINEMVREYENRMYSLGVILFQNKMTASDLWEIINKTNDVDFFTFAEKWIEKATIKGVKNYKSFLNSLETFVGMRKLPVSNITVSFLQNYSESLREKPRAQSLYMGEFRHLYRELRLHYEVENNPFEKFKIPKQILKGKRALDISIIRKVFAYDGTYKRAVIARDCCILSFFLMGMNSVDLYSAKTIKNGRICYERTKTKNRRSDLAYTEIDILPEIKTLLEKYKGKNHIFDFCEKYTTYQDFNRAINIGLKKIGEEIGIDGLQFYAFRHSWATIAYNEVGIDKYVIHEALIHISRDTAIDDVYIKKDYARINEANRKVINYLLNKS